MVDLKVVKRVNQESSSQEKEFFFFYLCEMIDVNQTTCGNHFTIYVSFTIHLKFIQRYVSFYCDVTGRKNTSSSSLYLLTA